MSALAEAMLSAFDSNAKVIWTTAGVGTAIATLTHNGLLVTTTFANVGGAEWQVGFTISPELQPANAVAQSSIRIFSGVFKQCGSFWRCGSLRASSSPGRTKHCAGCMRTYLERQDSELRDLGYRMVKTYVNPLVEYALEKGTPSGWRD